MGFRPNCYATVFGVEPGRGKFTKVRLSISRKNRESGEYEQDFADYCMFIGNAHTKAAMLKERDRIVVKDIDVSNRYDKESGRKFYDFKVFDFDFADAAGSAPAAPKQSQPARRPAVVESNPVDSDDESLPF